MKKISFRGSWVALITPFKRGLIDWKSLEKLVGWHIESGTHGLVIMGTTGEAATLREEERLAVIKKVVRMARGKTNSPRSSWPGRECGGEA